MSDGSGCEVLVVGGGNAGLSAALSAAEQGARVIVLEAADYRERGGNSAFTAGAMRTVYESEAVVQELAELSAAELDACDFGAYSRADFLNDMMRVTDARCDPDLTELLVDQSLESLRWLRSKGVRFVPSLRRQAFTVDGKERFWGGLALEVSGGGIGLVDSLTRACDAAAVQILYESPASELLTDRDGVTGVRLRSGTEERDIEAGSVVLACGGFESNAQWRAQHLGPGWDLARVRGTRHNTGRGIKMALEIGAAPAGHWSGCHSVAWDLNAPEFGDLTVRDNFQKHSYPLGIMVNANGDRFVDEGADFRNYTYAKYGGEILRQPGQLAWQIFDARVHDLLREEYRIREVTRETANSIEQLVAKLDGVRPERCLQTIREFNAAVDQNTPFDPSIRDGRGTPGLALPKSNWANPIDTPPFEAFAVTCGVTFTFGGLHISRNAEVLDCGGRPLNRLFACGELVGRLFYSNYPGGTGLTSGTVFGRIAGAGAARTALRDEAVVSAVGSPR